MREVAWFLGAHKGEDIKPLSRFFDCFALEANPNLELELNLILETGRILTRALISPLFQSELAKEDRTHVTFYSSEDRTTWGTIEVSRFLSGSSHTVFNELQVKTIDLRDLENLWPQPSLIVADLEGSEYESLVVPMLQRVDYYKDAIFVVEVSKDNWKEILSKLQLIYENFTVVINAEIQEVEDLSGPQELKPEKNGGGAGRVTSSIGHYLATTLIKGNLPSVFTPDPKVTMESWFNSKNTDLKFNFSAWVDLIAWPSSTETVKV